MEEGGILVEEDTRSYTALGATGGQTRISFASQNISALRSGNDCPVLLNVMGGGQQHLCLQYLR